MRKFAASIILSSVLALSLYSASPAGAKSRTYCNPINLDYAYVPDKDYSKNNAHRSTADPACVFYSGLFYLFSTNQEGYWWSKNLIDWNFISCLFKMNACADQVCAPAAWAAGKGVLFLPSFTQYDQVPLYISKDPRSGHWLEAVESFPVKAWDPSFFEDEDGKLYLYWGSSNFYPIYGLELDTAKGYVPLSKPHELLRLNPESHGWERFGENNQNGKMDPFIEGAWMNKFRGRYYLQYGAPGTEWNVYGDGVYLADSPLGPFKYQAHNPFSFKPTGFIRGAGHGSTFPDKYGNLWHIATAVISVKNTFERRLALFPASVDEDGVLYADTAFGDYPQYMPSGKRKLDSDFTGWTLLSYNKKCWASSSKSELSPDKAFDEDIKSYWSAEDGKAGQYLAVDLGGQMTLKALQLNFADEQALLYGKQKNIRHRYRVYYAAGEAAASESPVKASISWRLLLDKSRNKRDVPHDYLELGQAVKARYLKVENLEVPTGSFALSGFRVFGNSDGERPAAVKDFQARRDGGDRRNVVLNWQPVPSAYAYEIKYGVAADKLYGSFLVYGDSKYEMHSLNVEPAYFFRIRPVSESGLGELSQVLSAP